MTIIAFLKDFQSRLSPLLEFFDLERHEIPAQSGAYILIAGPSTTFTYPCGRSPVFYIGKANSLRQRLKVHLKYAMEAKSGRKLPLYWGRYEFAAAFGCRYATIRTTAGRNARDMEDVLLARFASRYRSFPVANTHGAWHRVEREMMRPD